jgi:hypothetical protein
VTTFKVRRDGVNVTPFVDSADARTVNKTASLARDTAVKGQFVEAMRIRLRH